jgi:hypothetical protein
MSRWNTYLCSTVEVHGCLHALTLHIAMGFWPSMNSPPCPFKVPISRGLTVMLCPLCRSLDIPAQHRNKSEFCHVLAIIPGPRAPKLVDAFVQGTLESFQRHCTGPEGDDQNVSTSPFRVFPFPVGCLLRTCNASCQGC